MWLKKTVSVIIPVARKEKSIFNVIQELDTTGYIDEIVVVNWDSDSETLKQIERTRARLVKQNKNGVGRAIKTGIKSTKADILVIAEPSGSFRGDDVSKLLSYSENFDTVFGSRTHVPLIGKGSGMTFLRRLTDDLFGKMISLFFLSSNITDVGCTFRLTNRKGWNAVSRELTSDDELFLTQWLIAAAKNKVRFIEIPVNFTAPETSPKKDGFLYLAIRGLRIFYLFFKMRLS